MILYEHTLRHIVVYEKFKIIKILSKFYQNNIDI